MELRYRNIREELIETLRAFADTSYQKRFWLHNELPIEGWIDDFNENINFFGDIGLDVANPEKIVGVILLNKEELDAVQATKIAIYNVLENIGREVRIPIEDYIDSPYWPDVVEKARIAYEMLTGGRNPDGYFEYIRQRQGV